MKDELHSVLDKLLPEFLKVNVEPNIICWRLHLSDHLSKDECDIISSKMATTQRFLEIFRLLKPKPDATFIRLQEICIEMGWMGMLNLIQSTLSAIEGFHVLIIEDGKDVHHKYDTSMNENLRNVLDILTHEFLKSDADPDSICSKLLFSGHLAKDECDLVESMKLTTAKFKVMFTFLKLKPEHVFKRLQEICVETDLIALYKLLQSKLAAIENCSRLIMTEEEFKFYQKKKKEHSKVQNWEPILFDVQDPVADFTGRDKQLKELHDIMLRSEKKTEEDTKKIVIVDKTSAVTGLGGIGKTQLALRYVQLYNQHYDNNIIWINAESDATLQKSFIKLAEKLKIYLKNANEAEKELPVIVEDVYTHFSKVKCLFVFDNADEPLKVEFYPNSQFHIYILITSRYQKWGQIKVFHLGNFTPDEAADFIRKRLKITTDVGEDQVANLAKTLHFFPLALTQATAYINEASEINKILGSPYSIDDYINNYNEHKQKLLNYDFDSDYGTVSLQTTFTTWKVTMSKVENYMKGEKKIGKVAIKILDYISYIAHEQIDTHIFFPIEIKKEIAPAVQILKQLFTATKQNDFLNVNSLIQELTHTPEKEEEIGMAVQLLKKFSMVTEENGLLNVHPLVQEVTRLNLKQKGIEKQTFTTVCEILKIYFEKLIQSQDYSKQKIMLPHSEKLLKEMKHWLVKNPSQQKNIEQESINILLIQMSNAYGNIGQQRQKKSVVEQLLAIETEHYGPNHYHVGITLAELGTAYGELGQPEKQKILLEKALVIEEKHYGPDHYEVARILVNLSNAYGALGQPQKQKTLLKKALAIKEKHYGPDHYEVAITLMNLGNAYGSLGQLEKRKTLLERALVIEEKHYGPDHYEVAKTLGNLGLAYGALRQPEKQKTLLERALVIGEKHYGPDHYEVARILVNLSNVYATLKQPKKQKTLLEKALPIQKKYYGSGHYEVAITLINLSNAYGALGQPETQKTLLEKALPILEKHYGPNHYHVGTTLIDLGKAYGDLGQPEKQKTLLEKALVIEEKYCGPDHYEVARILVHLSNAYGTLGQPEKQITLLERALVIKEKHDGPDHCEVARTLGNLGLAYGALGQSEKQKILLEKALLILEKHYGPDHYEVARILIDLNRAYGALRQPEKQKILLEKALLILKKYYGSDHYVAAITLIDLSRAYGALGQPEKEKTLLEKALPILEKHYGPDHYYIAAILVSLGKAYGDLRQPEKQKTLLEKALPILEKHYGPDHYHVATTLADLGLACGALGQPEKQKTLLEKALPILEKHYRPDHYEVARTLVNLSNAYGALGQPGKQKILLEKALVINIQHIVKAIAK